MKISVKNSASLLFFLLVMSLGFGTFYVDIGFAIKPYMIVLAITFFFLLLTKNIKIRKFLTYEKSWIVFLLVCCMTVLQFEYVSSNIRYILGLFFIFICYIILCNLLQLIEKDEIEKAISKVGILIALLTISYYVLGVIKCGFNFYGNDKQYFGMLIDRGVPRLISFMSDDPNITSLYITVFFFFYITKIKENFANKIGSALMIIILLLTFSRGAYIGIILTCLIVFVLMKEKTIKYKLWLITKISLVVIILALAINKFTGINIADTILGRFESSSNDMGSGRLILWKNAITTFNDNPIFGIGINSSLEYNVKYNTGNYVHNTYLEVLSETGIIGSIPYAIFIVSIIITSWKVYKYNKKDMYIFAAGLAILLQIMFLSVLLNEMIYVYLAILARYYILNIDKGGGQKLHEYEKSKIMDNKQ